MHPGDASIFCHTWIDALPAVPGRRRAARQVDAHPRRARRGAEGARDAARSGQDRLVAAGGGGDHGAGRRLRGAREPRRRPALRADHVGGDALRAATRSRSASTPSAHAKCERCWHYRADVGADPAHPTLCGRCVANLFGAGEPRALRVSPARQRAGSGRAADAATRHASRWWRWLGSRRRDRRRPGDQGGDPRRVPRRRGAARHQLLQPRARVQHRRGVQLPRRRARLAALASSRRSPIGASVVIVWLLRRGGSRCYCLGLALILGGALGNLWDRLTLGTGRRLPAVPLRAAGRIRRSTSPTARSRSARRC